MHPVQVLVLPLEARVDERRLAALLHTGRNRVRLAPAGALPELCGYTGRLCALRAVRAVHAAHAWAWPAAAVPHDAQMHPAALNCTLLPSLRLPALQSATCLPLATAARCLSSLTPLSLPTKPAMPAAAVRRLRCSSLYASCCAQQGPRWPTSLQQAA